MEVYHGSTVIVAQPHIIAQEVGRDFGPGFYVTDIKGQARRWAMRKVRIVRRGDPQVKAYVSKYLLDESRYTTLKCRDFPEPSLEWLEMVCSCRSDPNYRHGYDSVSGKIADNAVGETVSYVVQGIMRPEDAIERLQFTQINNQICLNTEAALECLRYLGCEEIL
jgi:hypothetical protein